MNRLECVTFWLRRFPSNEASAVSARWTRETPLRCEEFTLRATSYARILVAHRPRNPRPRQRARPTPGSQRESHSGWVGGILRIEFSRTRPQRERGADWPSAPRTGEILCAVEFLRQFSSNEASAVSARWTRETPLRCTKPSEAGRQHQPRKAVVHQLLRA